MHIPKRWDADEDFRAQVRGIHTKHGKHGATGTAFHIFVDTCSMKGADQASVPTRAQTVVTVVA